MAGVTPDELAVWMGRGEAGFTPAETARAELLLGVAHGLVYDEIGQSLEVSTDTVTLRGTGTEELVLPRWPVLVVVSVQIEDADDPLTEGRDYGQFKWKPDGVLTRRGCGWPRCLDVDVTYTAGHTTFPEGARGVIFELVSGAWETTGGKKSERIADYQVAWAREGMALSTSDKNTISRYTANR